ncbi:MAG: hypothetical protein QXX95_02485 [Nitrososphaerales archaeon]
MAKEIGGILVKDDKSLAKASRDDGIKALGSIKFLRERKNFEEEVNNLSFTKEARA